MIGVKISKLLAGIGLFTLLVVTFQNCGLLDNRIRGEIKFFGMGQPIDLSGKYVVPVYSTNGNWNDWITNSAVAPVDELHMSLVASCVGTESGRTYACVHVGEYRKLVVDQRTSCAGLTARDQLDAFDWLCAEENGTVTFYTWGLSTQRNKGLRDLVTDTEWRDNSIIVSENGSVIGQTTPAKWWTNPITPLPDNSGGGVVSLSTPSTIYTLSSSRRTAGYNIDGDKIGVVTINGAQLQPILGMGDSCAAGTGEAAAPDRRVILCSGSQKFLWIEADQSLNNLDVRYGLHLVNTTFSLIQNMTINGAFDRGFSVQNSRNLFVWNLGVHNTGDWLDDTAPPSPNTGLSPDEFGIYITNSTYLELHRIKQSQARFTGIRIENVDLSNMANISAGENRNVGFRLDAGSSNNRISDVTVYNNASHGSALLNGSSSNTLTGLVAINNASFGLHVGTNSNQNTIAFATVVNTSNDGIAVTGNSNSNTFFNVLALNNSGRAIVVDAGTGNKLINIVSGQNGSTLLVNNSVNTLIRGVLMTNAATCSVVGGSGNELNGACMHGAGTAISPIIADAGSSIVAGATSDSTNLNGATGVQVYGSISDWFGFDSPYRGWGLLATGFPSVGNRGNCTSGSCQIWDARIRAADTVVNNKSFDGINPNQPFVNGGPCPSQANGNNVETDTFGRTFLISAREKAKDDSVGNGNGLCESGERCVFAPHFGAFQGQGSQTTQSCVFQNGTVSGVTLYNYSQSGI